MKPGASSVTSSIRTSPTHGIHVADVRRAHAPVAPERHFQRDGVDLKHTFDGRRGNVWTSGAWRASDVGRGRVLLMNGCHRAYFEFRGADDGRKARRLDRNDGLGGKRHRAGR